MVRVGDKVLTRDDLEREMPAEDCQPSETEQDEIDLLYRTIDKLPEKCKRVFLMASLHDKTYQEIADELCISVNTVLTHRKNIARKLQIRSVAGLTIYAIVNKLVNLEEVDIS